MAIVQFSFGKVRSSSSRSTLPPDARTSSDPTPPHSGRRDGTLHRMHKHKLTSPSTSGLGGAWVKASRWRSCRISLRPFYRLCPRSNCRMTKANKHWVMRDKASISSFPVRRGAKFGWAGLLRQSEDYVVLATRRTGMRRKSHVVQLQGVLGIKWQGLS